MKYELPTGIRFETIDGGKFMQVKAAARMAGIHPVILEMGQRLLKSQDREGAAFVLATPEMQKRGDDIEAMIVKGLKRVAKASNTGAVNVKSYRQNDRLTFWYVPKVGRVTRKAS